MPQGMTGTKLFYASWPWLGRRRQFYKTRATGATNGRKAKIRMQAVVLCLVCSYSNPQGDGTSVASLALGEFGLYPDPIRRISTLADAWKFRCSTIPIQATEFALLRYAPRRSLASITRVRLETVLHSECL